MSRKIRLVTLEVLIAFVSLNYSLDYKPSRMAAAALLLVMNAAQSPNCANAGLAELTDLNERSFFKEP